MGFAPTDQQRLTQGTPNNEAERTIRQAVMGRKNFYGSRSIDGADLAAVMYTIIETCKKAELDPRSSRR